MGFVIRNPLIPDFKTKEEFDKFISSQTPGFLRKIGLDSRATGVAPCETKYDYSNPNSTLHRSFGDT